MLDVNWATGDRPAPSLNQLKPIKLLHALCDLMASRANERIQRSYPRTAANLRYIYQQFMWKHTDKYCCSPAWALVRPFAGCSLAWSYRSSKPYCIDTSHFALHTQ